MMKKTIVLGAFAALSIIGGASAQSVPFNAYSVSTLGGNCTAQGSILVQSANGQSICLGAGGNGQLLQSQGPGADPGWYTVVGTGSVTSVGLAMPSIFSVSGSPVTAAGTLTATLTDQAANTVFAGPTTGAAATPTFRAMVGADLPDPGASTKGGVISSTAGANQFATGVNTSAAITYAQPAFSNLSGTAQIAQGGTGETTANDAFNAFVPSQVGKSGDYLTTDGTNTAWATIPTNYGFEGYIESRAIAASMDLTGVNAVRTMGYANAGDGGGATFQNVGATDLIDTQISAATLVGGSGYTDAVYTGVRLTGGTGYNAIGTVTVSGGAVTSVVLDSPDTSVGYAIGDVLSAQTSVIGAGSGFTWTVTALTTPLASFTDAAGNNFQYVLNGDYINPKSFGAKFDWTVNDAGATNDYDALQATLVFAGHNPSQLTPDTAASVAATVLLPQGTSLICGGSNTLQVPAYVRVIGQGPGGSALKLCDSGLDSDVHFVTLCSPTIEASCFGAQLSNLKLFADDTPPATSDQTAMVYSNNVQQFNALDRVAIYSGLRSCLHLSDGYGGAAYVGIRDMLCTPWPAALNNPVYLSWPSGVVSIANSIVEVGGIGSTNSAVIVADINILDIDGFHQEGFETGIHVLTTNTSAAINIHNAVGGNNCTNLLLRQGSAIANRSVGGMLIPNTCTNTINNGGALTTGVVIADTVF
jgi:hypothetical protein